MHGTQSRDDERDVQDRLVVHDHERPGARLDPWGSIDRRAPDVPYGTKTYGGPQVLPLRQNPDSAPGKQPHGAGDERALHDVTDEEREPEHDNGQGTPNVHRLSGLNTSARLPAGADLDK